MADRSTRFQVQFTVDGDGKVQAEMQSITQEAKKSAKAANEAGQEWYEMGYKIGNALKWAGVTVAAGVALIIRNTIQAEQEIAQLGAVLRSSGQDATYSKEQLSGWANEIAKASNYSAGEIINAQTRLLSYSGIASSNFKDALQVAIDQSARLGISVEQSSEIIGRALESPTKAAAALAQQGFGSSFTPAVMKQLKALEAAGREAEAQVVVLDILKGSYAGAAAAARDTLGGALLALKNTAADLLTGDTGSEGLRGVRQAVEDLNATLGSAETRQAFADITEGALSTIAALAELINWLNRTGTAMQENLTNQLGGHDRLAGGESLAAQRRELAQVQAELARRARGDAEMQTSGNATELLWTMANRARTAPFRLLGAQGIGGSTDAELRRRAASLNSQIGFNEAVFGDPNVPRVLMSDRDAMPESYLNPKPQKNAPIPAYIDPAAAKRAERALASLREAQRAMEREAEDTGSPILNAYARALDDIAKRGEDAARNGVPIGQIKEFKDTMTELAAAVRDREIQRFQAEFNQQTADMVAQLGGPAAQALNEYAKGLKAANDELARGTITPEMFAAREKALADQRDASAQSMLADIAAEQAALLLNNQQLEIYNNLKAAGVEANTAFGQAIVQATQQLQRQRDMAMVSHEVRDAISDLGTSALVNFGAAGDAAERFGERMKRMAAQMLMDKAMSWLFGAVMGGIGGSAAGYTGNGLGAGAASGFGNNLGSMVGRGLFGFGGGRAIGGGVNRDNVYPINEGGRPEILRQGHQRYLLPGTDGVVMPVAAAASSAVNGAGGYGSVVINNYGGGQVRQSQETTQMPDGSELRRLVVDIFADDVNNGGRVAAAIKGRFDVGDRLG